MERNLFLNSEEELFLLYQFLLIYKIFGSKNNKNKKKFDDRYYLKDFYFISFKIYFIVTHQQYYECITNDFFNIYERLLFMKKFYKESLVNKVQNPYIITKIKKIQKKENELGYIYNGYKLGELKNINIDELFDEDELKLNKEIFETLKHFYKIDEEKGIDIIHNSNIPEFDDKNYNFVTNLVDLKYSKKINLKNFDKMKNNIINLEKNIHRLSSHLFCKEGNSFLINKNIRAIYNSLIKELKTEANMAKLEFYPVGSTAEFLYFEDRKNVLNDDLNIYMDIHKLKVGERKDTLHKIKKYLFEKHKAKKKKSLFFNNLIYEFFYKETKITLIVLGFGPYIHSLLFRAYSSMDPRFPMVGLALKKFLRLIEINKPDDKYYHNTFLFMNLLVAFLQDIIEPPILPKIFSSKNSEIIPINLPFSHDFESKINSFIDNLNYENIHIPKHLNDKDMLRKIYQKQIDDNKNNLTCAEIFLYFLEFLIYYFKYDALYVNNSLEFEGFDHINNIFKDEEDIDDDGNYEDIKYPNDILFNQFAKKYYKLKRKEINGEHNKNGIFLIRDPVNPFYNIGQIMNDQRIYDKFYLKIKKGYDILLNTGSFDELKRIK